MKFHKEINRIDIVYEFISFVVWCRLDELSSHNVCLSAVYVHGSPPPQLTLLRGQGTSCWANGDEYTIGEK